MGLEGWRKQCEVAEFSYSRTEKGTEAFSRGEKEAEQHRLRNKHSCFESIFCLRTSKHLRTFS